MQAGVTLRPYQERALRSLREAFRAGKRKIVLVLPTGGGKTVLFAQIISNFLARSGGQPVIVIVHRRELVTQTLAKLADVGIEAGVVMGSDKRSKPGRVQVCSIQTLQRRLAHLPPAGLVIYDECHHAVSPRAREVLAAYPEAILLGFTATPWRADKVGLADVFQSSIVAATPKELQSIGALVPCDPFAYATPDLRDVGTVAGDFNQRDLGTVCNTAVLVGAAVAEYAKHTPGRRALCFPVNCEHSRALVAGFNQAGFAARHIDWSTPADERTSVLSQFASGAVQIVSSVGVLTEGFDCPVAEVCVLARPTKSLSLFIQMCGRVLRPADGKTRAVINDHGGNILRLGFPDDDRDCSLTTTPPYGRTLQVCTDCQYITAKWNDDGTCPRCGSLQQLPVEHKETSDAEKRAIEEVDGIRLDRAAVEKLRTGFKSRGRPLSQANAIKILRATTREKVAEYLRLKEVAQRKNFKPGFIGHQYREVFGSWPRFTDAELAGVEPASRPFIPLASRPPPPRPPPPGTCWECRHLNRAKWMECARGGDTSFGRCPEFSSETVWSAP